MKLNSLCAFLLVFFIANIPLFLFGQSISDVKITVNFQGESVKAAIEKIESTTPIRFYFQEDQLPNRTITANFNDATLEAVMTEILNNTPLGYFAYRDFAVVIAPWITIQEVYSADYYQALEENLNSDDEDREKRKQLIIGGHQKFEAFW